MVEFFSMTDIDKKEIINNALEAGPTIPFPNFSKLFKTWLEVISTFSEEQRIELFSSYINEAKNSPQKLIAFHLDGILEIFLSLKPEEKKIISKSLKEIFDKLDQNGKKILFTIIPENARVQIGI